MKKALIVTLFLGLFMAGISSSANASLVNSKLDNALVGGTIETFSNVSNGEYSQLYLPDLSISNLGEPIKKIVVDDMNGFAAIHGTGKYFNNYRGGLSTFDIIFNDTVKAFGINMGLVITDWTLSAYDINNKLIEAQTLPDPDGYYNAFYGIAAAGIKRVNFSSDPNESDHVIFDNLTYITDNGGSPVPIPSTIGLLSLGLMGLAGTTRKKTNA